MSQASLDPALRGELDRLLRACIGCGLCLPHCATYLATGHETQSPRGRLRLLAAVLAAEPLGADASAVGALDRCLGCYACVSACPSGISPRLLDAAKAAGHEARRGLASALAARLLPRRAALAALRGPARLARAALPAGGAGPLRLVAATPDSLTDDALAALLERLVAGRGGARPATRAGAARAPGAPPPVLLFAGCASAGLLPATQARFARLLRAAGCAVTVPAGQVCCGAFAAHVGQGALASRHHEANRTAFAAALAADPAAVVVVEAAGCGHELRALPPDFSARVRDAAELLAGLALPAPRAVPLRVVYHDPCHARHGQGIHAAPRALLGALPGLALREPEEAEVCCGSGGPYALLHRELSARMGRRKAERLAATGADLVVTGNPGCHGQIAAALREVAPGLPVVPLTDLLWHAHLGGGGADA